MSIISDLFITNVIIERKYWFDLEYQKIIFANLKKFGAWCPLSAEPTTEI